ncbi:MAG: thrombospondin type 3 repeat-containing protein, partial [Candidatus Diapherotrites archaeon]|nr:thrombospondin type 3 repeat-containing protein [Candidatus Diapherotrites archaeon]
NPGQEEAFCTNSENESLLQECNACTNGACTPNPVLSCPTAPVNYDYSFEWGKGETKARWLQIGYDNKFSGLTYKELDTYESSKQIANDFKSIIEYSKKSTTKKLYARIRATSNQNRQIYSNTCEFTLKQPIVPALTCPTSPVTQSSTFLFSPNDYTNNSLELSFNNSFATTRIETASNNIVQAADLRDDIDLFKRYYNSSIKNNTFYARIYGKEAYFGIAYSNICTFIIQNGTLKEQTTTPLTLELSSLTANQSEGLATIIKTSATTQNNNAIHFLSYPDINQILNQTINTNTTSKRISAKTLDTNAKTDSGETVQQTLIEEQNQSGQIEQGILYTITTDINNHPEANNTARTDAKSTSTCELKYTDSGQCDSKWQFYQISFTSSTISEARYRFVDCTTGNILGKGQICSGEQSPKHYRPEGHSVKFEMDYYTCPNNKCKIETPNLCTGVTCTNYCWTGNRYYNGTCTQGVCNYSNQNCPNNSCTNGSCIANNCPNGCAAYCGGNTLFYTGYCSNSTCIYNTSTTCQNGCTNGACNSQTCATGWKCKDTITKAYQNSDCTWSTETNCPSGCNNGACIQTTCSAGWRCYDPYSKGYQNNNCTWNSITSCQNGCNNASCLAGKTPGDNDYCTTSKPCQAGEGNCHNGNECQTGLYCMEAEGARYGYSPPTNVCEEREGAGEWKCQTQNQLGFQLYETKEWTDTINCNNGCENGTCKGSILKDTDSDNDGYSDEDEQLARSNPNDPNSTPFTELRKYSDTINIAEKMTVLELITNILEPGIMQKANFEACKKSKEETNNTALHFSAQNQCKASLSAYKPLAIYMGYCIGAASGVYSSVKDFFTFFIDAFWYLASISNNISILSTDLKNFRDSLSDITNNINAQTAIIVWDSIYKQKYQEGALLSANNQFITDYDDHAGFAHAYANGYISWYISAMVAGGKGASSAIKSVKTGATATKTVETAETIFQNYPRLAKATQTGGKISEAVNTLAKKYPLQWVDDVYGKVGDGVGEVKNIWKGKNFSWADETFYNHTFVEIRINETTTRAQQIMQAFPKSFKKNEDIINAIGKTIEDGERNNVGNIVKAFPSKNSESRYLEIRVGNNGRINTIIPGDKIA